MKIVTRRTNNSTKDGGPTLVVEYHTIRQYVTFVDWGVTLTINDASGTKTFHIPWTNIEYIEELI